MSEIYLPAENDTAEKMLAEDEDCVLGITGCEDTDMASDISVVYAIKEVSPEEKLDIVWKAIPGLSERIHKQYSQMREFEKERFDPLQKRFETHNEFFNGVIEGTQTRFEIQAEATDGRFAAFDKMIGSNFATVYDALAAANDRHMKLIKEMADWRGEHSRLIGILEDWHTKLEAKINRMNRTIKPKKDATHGRKVKKKITKKPIKRTATKSKKARR